MRVSWIRRKEQELYGCSPRVREQGATVALATARDSVTEVRMAQDGIAGQYADSSSGWRGELMPAGTEPSVDPVELGLCRLFLAVAFVALGSEAFFSMYAAMILLAVPRLIAAGIGLLVGACQTLLWKAVIALTYDREHPRASVRRTGLFAGVSSLLAIALITLLQSLRLTVWSIDLLPGTLTALSAALSAAGAAWLDLARQRGERNHLAKAWLALEAEIRATTRFIDRLTAAVTPAEAPARDPSLVNISRPSRAAVTSIVTLALLLGARPTNAAQPFGQVLVLDDGSGSVEVADRRSVFDALLSDPRSFSAAVGDRLEQIVVVTWASAKEAWAAGRRFRIAKLAEPEAPAVGTDERFVFQVAVRHLAKQRQAAVAEAHAKWERDLEATLVAARGAVGRDVAGRRGAASCVGEALARAVAEPAGTLVVLVTDGLQENCGPLGAVSERGGADVVVVVLPATRDGAAVMKRTRERSELLRRAAPGVVVLPWHRVDSSWGWLGDRAWPHVARNDSTRPEIVPVASVVREVPSVISVSEPSDRGQVGVTALVRGQIATTTAEPEIFVHPLAERSWWRQRAATRTGASQWQALAQFGEKDVGEREYFELVAIAVPPQQAVPVGREISSAELNRMLDLFPHTGVLTVQRKE